MDGNPWLRLLRREVEDLARTLHGERYLREQQARTELARINRELKQLRAQMAALGERRAALLSGPRGQGPPRQWPCPPRPRDGPSSPPTHPTPGTPPPATAT